MMMEPAFFNLDRMLSADTMQVIAIPFFQMSARVEFHTAVNLEDHKMASLLH